ncbi:aconitase subunit 2, partial [Burkholderia multivorans]
MTEIHHAGAAGTVLAGDTLVPGHAYAETIVL